MTDLVEGATSRVAFVEVGDNRQRIAIDDQVIGPVLTSRAARVVKRWLEAGALDDLEGGGGGSKLEKTLRAVDHAWDAAADLLKNGLR